MIPWLFIVGSGRCGTRAWARCMYGRHEDTPHLMRMCGRWLRGEATDGQAIDCLRQEPWNRVEAAFYYTPLVPLLDELFSPCWLWTVRRPDTTVASMINAGWYQSGGKLAAEWGRMITGPALGEEWQDDPLGRCAWWWSWSARRLVATLPPGRSHIERLEWADPNPVSDWCHITHRGANLPAAGGRNYPPLDDKETALVRRLVGPIVERLYPRVEPEGFHPNTCL